MEWISVNEQMPEPRERVLAFYTNEYKRNRIELACYIPPRTVKAEDYLSEEAEGCSEYDEENDIYWVIEGWFEDSWESDMNWQLNQTITHWMPLPEIPERKERITKQLKEIAAKHKEMRPPAAYRYE